MSPEGVMPASTTCHAGSDPRGPRLVFVSGPCDQNPNIQMADWLIIQPEKATIRTRYHIHRPYTAASRTYTLPMHRMKLARTTPPPLNMVPHATLNLRKVSASIRAS